LRAMHSRAESIATRVVRLIRSTVCHVFFCTLALPLFLISCLRLVFKRGPRVLCRGWAPRSAEKILSREAPFGRRSFIQANGQSLGILESGDAGQPLLLLLPGFPESAYAWRWWLRAFSHAYHVVAVDQRGYNLSSKPASWCGRSRDYRARELVADVEALIVSLGHGKRGEKVTLAVHDWGGLVGWCVAGNLDKRGALEKLIVINAPHPTAYFRNAGIAQLLKSLYIVFFQLPYLPEFILSRNDGEAINTMLMGKTMGVRRRSGTYALTNEDIEVFKFAFSRRGASTAALNWYRQLLDATHDDFSALAPNEASPLRAPALILWGQDDGALGPELIRGTEAFCGMLTTRLIPDCSHWAQQDAVEDVLKAAAEFLGCDVKLSRRN
jgi:pimeloyl-ACP methyl ester carboxylesterase